MICYGWRSFKGYEVVYHCDYLPNGRFMTWLVLPLLGEDYPDTFPDKEQRYYDFIKRVLHF